MTKYRSQFIAITTAFSFALADSPARADEDHVALGLGVASVPAYEGADKHRTLPIPVIDVQWGPLFANLGNGIGINIVDTDLLTVGTSVMFMQGYRREDAPRGIGALSSGAGARGFASLKAAGFVASVGVTKGVVGGTKGVIADASLSYPIAVNPRLSIVPTIGTTWADAKHNNRYFGVDAPQSKASGLPRFTPGGGMKDVSATLTVSYRLTEHVVLGATAGVTTLLSKVKDSPIVIHRNAQPLGFVSASYLF